MIGAVRRSVALRHPAFAVPNALGPRPAHEVISHRAVGKRCRAEARDGPRVSVAWRREHQPRVFKRLQSLANRLHQLTRVYGAAGAVRPTHKRRDDATARSGLIVRIQR